MKQEEAYLFAVDINPSIEIYTDEQFHMIDLHYLNEDGKTVIDALNRKKVHIDDVMDEVINIAVEKKYLTKNKAGLVALTIVC